MPQWARVPNNRDGFSLSNPIKKGALGTGNLAEQNESASAVHEGLQVDGRPLYVQCAKHDGDNYPGLVLPQNSLVSVGIWVIVAETEVLRGEHLRLDFVLFELSCERGQQVGIGAALRCRRTEDNNGAAVRSRQVQYGLG